HCYRARIVGGFGARACCRTRRLMSSRSCLRCPSSTWTMCLVRRMSIAEQTTPSGWTMIAVRRCPLSGWTMGHRVDGDGRSSGGVVIELLDAHHDVALDDADSFCESQLEALSGDAIDVAQVPAACVVEESQRVG